ncbi:MAG: Crp/Fnr family transcriptional regulator, partial [Acinetobacter sp.]|nr:Crp/Fnr family transcriptional regulator [Acinetobacter sp.]
LSAANECYLDAKERLFARGDESDGLYCVVEGAIKLTGTAASGKEAILAIVDAPTWFGEIALFDGQARTHDAWADEPATLLHIRGQFLTSLLQQHPEWWREFGVLLSQKIRLAFTAMEAASIAPLHVRLAQRLLIMAQGFDGLEGSSKRIIRVPQEQLGQMLAISRQTVNQLLKQLEVDGVIQLQRGTIEVINLTRLKEIVDAQH